MQMIHYLKLFRRSWLSKHVRSLLDSPDNTDAAPDPSLSSYLAFLLRWQIGVVLGPDRAEHLLRIPERGGGLQVEPP